MRRKPTPAVGQWWLFDRKEKGRVKRILPGGAGNLGIVEFDGLVPSAHVSTMLQFPAWQPCAPPTGLEAPCTCVTLDGGAVRHDASGAKPADVTVPALEGTS